MYTKDNSWNNFVTHMIEEGYAKSEDTLLEHMALIPSKSREIIEKRWGLIEKVYYSSFEQLNEQMGIDNARELYFEAMRDLFNAEYATIGMKRYNLQTISHWNEVVAYGMLFAPDIATSSETTITKKNISKHLLSRSLKGFKILPGCLHTPLAQANCKTLKDVLNLGDKLLEIPRFGQRRALELMKFLRFIGISENEGKDMYLFIGKYFNLQEFLLAEEQDHNYIIQTPKSEVLKRPLDEFESIHIGPLKHICFKYNTLEDILNCDPEELIKQLNYFHPKDDLREIIYFLNFVGIDPNEHKEFYSSLMKQYGWDFPSTTNSD